MDMWIGNSLLKSEQQQLHKLTMVSLCFSAPMLAKDNSLICDPTLTTAETADFFFMSEDNLWQNADAHMTLLWQTCG